MPGVKPASPLLALAAAAALAACSPAAVPAPREGPAFAAPAPELGIENAARIADGVYRGAQPDAAGLKALKEKGFRTVVNFRTGHSEKAAAEALGLAVVEIPIEAAMESEPPTDEQIRRFFEVVLDPGRRPVFFHCAVGKDRTGTMAALYRIEVDGWANEDAVAEMRHFGYHDWYKDLVAFVRAYRPRGYGGQAGR